MKCVENYTERCITPQEKKHLDNEVHGAKALFENLCFDKQFQMSMCVTNMIYFHINCILKIILIIDYLKHRECYQFIQDDWNTCQKEFNKLLKDTIPKTSQNNQYLEYCW